MWLFSYSIQKLSRAALSRRVIADKKKLQPESKPTTYWQVVKYLFETYPIDEVTSKTEAKIANLYQQIGMPAVMKLFGKRYLDVA